MWEGQWDEGYEYGWEEEEPFYYEEGYLYDHDYDHDTDIEYSEEEGKLYYFKYNLDDGSGEHIPVATTRPETILGDAAVCVHPEDERYKHLVGKEVVVPILGRKVPVIAECAWQVEKYGMGEQELR